MNAAKPGHVGVLMGGCSSERDISLKSGHGVAEALASTGCRVSPLVVTSEHGADIVRLVRDSGIEVAFIALHGRFGEDGTVQAILEKLDIPYTGSGPEASRKALDKVTTQTLWKAAGLPVPDFWVIRKGADAVQNIIDPLPAFPVVVKPSREGSSFGVTIVRAMDQLSPALEKAFAYGPDVLVERFIRGREGTAGILDGRALPLVEIRPKAVFFDFEAKYQKGMTEYLVPAPLPEDVAARIQQMAVKAHGVLGCADFSRVDFMLDEENNPFLLEINTIPGFTPTSLLPKAAAAAGYAFPDLCVKLVELACRKRAKTPTKI
ncbi:MAG: D-alanine--D-alanine ligase [Candidatus Omnitrophota bacterium]|nr:D-alanine--D-alanine ligase [Candidatus Omnitrophota bacterium]MDZ4242363.1 D-alanine--D-alanine ligase [Candidatus Omnitrophota bacterium]